MTLSTKLALVLALAAATRARSQEAAPIIPIHTVDELYANVQDPGNENATLLLDPMTFKLAHGALVLQAGMALVGQPGATIDGTSLTAADIAVIRIGRDNRVEGLAVKGPHAPAPPASRIAQPLALIDAAVDSTVAGGVNVEIRRCDLDGAAMGIRCRHTGAANAGLDSRAIIEGNTIANAYGAGGSAAILVQNTSDASRWSVTLRDNDCSRSLRGLLVVHLSNRGAENTVLSMRNRYHDNNTGGVVMGGRDNNANGNLLPSEADATRLDSVDDRFENNSATLSGTVGPESAGGDGGLLLWGALHTVATDLASTDNQMRVQLLGARFAGNVQVDGSTHIQTRRHITAVGGVGNKGISPGTGNQVQLLMRRTANEDGIPDAFVVDDSSPDDPSGTNAVTLTGTDVAFDHANVDFVAPDDAFSEGR